MAMPSSECKSSKITYFEQPGSQNTEKTLQLAKERVLDLGIEDVVVATTTGKTGLLAHRIFANTDVNVTVVAEHYGFKQEGEWLMEDEYLEKLREEDANVMTQSHILSGLERSIRNRFGGVSHTEAIAESLRSLFGCGVKVCVEIAIMAADSGEVPCGDGVEVMCVAGTGGGADTAVVLRPAHMNSFFKLKVKEIVCMPRR
jgi:uncharacterized protein